MQPRTGFHVVSVHSIFESRDIAVTPRSWFDPCCTSARRPSIYRQSDAERIAQDNKVANFIIGPDELHSMKRLLDVSEGLHARRELYRKKLPQVSLPNANGFPALTPLRVTKSFINFRGLSFNVMVVVAIRIHPYREKDHEIDKELRKQTARSRI